MKASNALASWKVEKLENESLMRKEEKRKEEGRKQEHREVARMI
jgi:hypothetical protein